MKIGNNVLFELLRIEVAASKKYYIVFFVILVVFLSITIAMFSAAISVPAQYKKDLSDVYPNGAGVLISTLSNVDAIKNSGADYVTFHNSYATNLVTLKNGNKSLDDLSGEAHIFKNETNRNSYLSKIERPFISGRVWNASDNNGHYNIWLSAFVANALNVTVGGIVRPDIGYTFELNVIGIYEDHFITVKESTEEGNFYEIEIRDNPDFIISYDLVNMFAQVMGESIDLGTAYLEVYDVIDIAKIADKLTKENIDYLDFSNAVENVRALNLSKSLFWLLTFLLLFVGIFAVSNIISMIVNVREKGYGLYKMLGCETSGIIKICFLGLLFILILSLVIGIFCASLIGLYFQSFASNLFNIEFHIGLVWYAPLMVFTMHLLAFALYYLKFKRKFASISPLSILLEEK
ncbi:MAG: hypothetical protein LBQ40_05040 [Clostridiales bacterium]|jgi:hypothetical protein|nr:hypothetical protein [Clostridiales bacterium]